MLNHVPFALEPGKSTADRSSAHGKMPCQVPFDNPGPRRKPAVNDQFADFVEGLSQTITVDGL